MQTKVSSKHVRSDDLNSLLLPESDFVEYNGINITCLIHTIRGKRVIVDSDLANLYSVKTKRLNEQVSRNQTRFPKDFMFELTREEKDELVAKCDQLKRLKYSSSLPKVFTEHGVVMASSILKTKRAVEVSVFVVRGFIRLRKALSTHMPLLDDFSELRDQFEIHDQAIRAIIKVVRELMDSSDNRRYTIGFKHDC